MYYIFIEKRNGRSTIKNSEGIGVWIAAAKDPIPFSDEDTEEYQRFSAQTPEEVSKITWEDCRKVILYKNPAINSEEKLLNLVKNSLKRRYGNDDDGGATCTKCGTHNEYATASDSFICGSCRSYETMVG